MKNPNKYGSVTKLSGNRRKPWVAREGISGRQKPIGYAETREQALILLAQFNANPWDIEGEKITLQQLYDLWLEKRAVKLSKVNCASLKAAYAHCKKLGDQRYKGLKSYQMQDCIDSCGRGYSTQGAIKALWGHLDRFAMELDIINKCNSDLLASAPIPETSKTIFTDDEVQRVWDNQHIEWADSVLFFLYTGFRFTEMLTLRVEDVNTDVWTITGGIKTKAGKNRVVPIHSKIKPIVQNRIERSKSGYLFEFNGAKLNTTFYRAEWRELMKLLELDHTPHECRHTFRSRMDSAGANKVCIDRIMGHKSKEVGERVYTHKDIEELRLNIELVTN